MNSKDVEVLAQDRQIVEQNAGKQERCFGCLGNSLLIYRREERCNYMIQDKSRNNVWSARGTPV